MHEGDTAVRVAVRGHFTPNIDETDDNAAGDENAVDFEKVHTGLQGVRSGAPSTWEYGAQTSSAVFLTGILLWSTIPIVGRRRMPA